MKKCGLPDCPCATATGATPRERVTDREILLTPEPFAKLLLELASLPGVIRRGPRQVALGLGAGA